MKRAEGELFRRGDIRYKYVGGQSRKLCVGDNNTCNHLISSGGLCVGHKNGTVRTPNRILKKGDTLILNGIRYQFNGLQKVRLCIHERDGVLCKQVSVKDGMCKSHSPHWKCKFTGYDCDKIRTQGEYCVQHVGNICNYVTMTKEMFISAATIIHYGYYLYDEVVFINATEKIDIRCPIHGLFKQRPCEHLRPRNCPRCKYSVGELKLGNFLQSINTTYEDQIRFDSCRSERPLPFDFWLAEYNLLIEFDGRQHFEEVPYWEGDIIDGLAKRIRHDIIKDNWCINNNKVLLRISYVDIDNIAEIIKLAIEHIKIAGEEIQYGGYVLATSFYDRICNVRNEVTSHNRIRDTSHYITIV